METELFGREPERRDLTDALEQACRGRPGLVLCQGEPGIGKTRLTLEVARQAESDGVMVAWGRGSDTPGAPPFWPWRQVLRTLAGQLDLCALAEEDRLAPDLVPLAPDVFVGDERVAADDPPADKRFRQFDALRRLLSRLSRQEPMLLVLDDLQWADPVSLLMLRHVVRTLGDDRLLVVANVRDTDGAPGFGELQGEPATRRIRLRGLPPDAVRLQLAAILGRPVSESEAGRVHELTSGNPFFVAEVARSEGFGSTSVAGAGFREVVGARLRDLGPGCVELLEAAAVLGRTFPVAVVAGMLGQPMLDCLAMLDKQAAAIVERAGTGEYRFVHEVVRGAVVAGLGAADRVRLHRRAAAAIEECYHGRLEPHLFDLARHWATAADGGERERATGWLRRAGDEAMRRLAFEDAARLFEQSLDVGAEVLDEEERCRLLVCLAAARQASGDDLGGVEASRDAARLADELHRSDLLAEAALALQPGFVPDANLALRELCESALAGLGADQVGWRARVAARYAETCHFLLDVEAARPACEGLVALAEGSGDPVALAAALQARQLVRSGPGGLAERTAVADRMVVLGRETAQPRTRLWGHLWRIDTAFERGDLATVAGGLNEAAWCARQIGGPLAYWQVARVRAMLAQAQARFADARRHLDEGFAAVAGHEDPDASIAQAGLTSAAEHHGGGMADTLAAMGLTEPVAHHPDLLAGGVVAALATAWMLTDLGRLDDAATIYRQLGPAETWRPVPHCALLGYAFGVQVARALAESDGSYAEELASLRRRLEPYRGHHVVSGAGCIGYLGPVELWLGVAAAHQDPAQAVVDLERAMAISGRCGMPGFETEARYELAAALSRRGRAGDRARARELATEAATRAATLGMAPFVDKARLLLDRLDPPPSALTPREREVAALVAQGLTNRDIAARLYLSERTAQTHVQHILTKLDLANRSQLAAWVTSREIRTPLQ